MEAAEEARSDDEWAQSAAVKARLGAFRSDESFLNKLTKLTLSRVLRAGQSRR